MAGGMQALLQQLMPRLDGGCLTVNGCTLAENAARAVRYNEEVIRSLERPGFPGTGHRCADRNPGPGRGNPEDCGSSPGTLEFFWQSTGVRLPARRAGGAPAGKIQPGDAVVLRYMGLKGRFGTTAFPFQEELKGYPALYHTCAILTDGRFSGGTSGLSVGYASPEAALGGPLAAVRDGRPNHHRRGGPTGGS